MAPCCPAPEPVVAVSGTVYPEYLQLFTVVAALVLGIVLECVGR